MLDRETVAQRIVAARTIRGLTQAEANRLFHEASDGDFGKSEIGGMERLEIPVGASRRAMLAKILNVPEAWFTTDADELFAIRGDDTVAQINERLSHIEAAIQELVNWSQGGPTRKELEGRINALADLAAETLGGQRRLHAQLLEQSLDEEHPDRTGEGRSPQGGPRRAREAG